MRCFTGLLALFCCALAGGPAEAERRLALAVGIDVYDNLPADQQLQKAVNDARAMGKALGRLGFETVVEENVARHPFTRAWQKFLNRLEPGDTAALFFAGHGVEIGGLNYLLPRDVPKVVAGEDRVLAEAAIRFNTLMDDLRDKKVRVALFIVDACRDNPFRDGSGRSVGGTRGLARLEPAEGSFVMYSAGAGEEALDRLPGADRSPNSLYTRTLLPILETPGLSLQDIAIKVRRQVVEVARGAGRRQTPAYYDQIVGDFVLKAGLVGDAKGPARPQPPSEAARAWETAKDSTDIAVLEAFRRQYGAANPFYDRLAEARIEELSRRQRAAMLKAEAERRRGEAELLRPGRVFRDCPDVCPEMVVVPAGSFTMGAPPGEEGRDGYDGPQHQVTIARPFAVGKYEVTFAEWDACVVAGGCKHSPRDPGWGRGRQPVINISSGDIAGEYLPWLSRKTGETYRLLTEAEWEYSARAGTTTRYHFGNGIAKSVAQFSASKTAPVGSFQPNAFGLFDMHGNVFEWVQDCWNSNYRGAPSDGSAWTSGDCTQQVMRGGSWNSSDPRFLRSAARIWSSTFLRISDLGFRVARTF